MINTDPRFEDLTGRQFGILFVIEFKGSKNGDPSGNKRWLVRCLGCGREFVMAASTFKYSNHPACLKCSYELRAHRRIVHGATIGHTSTRTYKAWSGAKERILNQSNHAFDRYGGRGIRMCARWLNSFESFREDMGECPDKIRSLDRKDTNGHYSCGHCPECITNGWPANCKWSTPREQSLNRRNALLLTLDGKTQNLTLWAQEVGLKKGTLWKRKQLGWTDREALLSPVKTP